MADSFQNYDIEHSEDNYLQLSDVDHNLIRSKDKKEFEGNLESKDTYLKIIDVNTERS